MRYTISTSDRKEHLLALHGEDYYCALWDMDQWLRKQIKYNPKRLNGDKLDALEMAREELRDILDDREVSFEMVE